MTADLVVARTAWLDWYVEPAGSAVFVDDQVVVLSELATAILEAVPADGTADLAALTASLVTRFGPPPPDLPGDPAADAVDHLLDAGVLRRAS